MKEHNNLIAAVLLSTLIIFGWNWFFEKPKIEQKTTKTIEKAIKKNKIEKINQQQLISNESSISNTKDHRIAIQNDKIIGSLNLKGIKFDDLQLKQYKDSLDKNSENVTLLSPINTNSRYFIDFGWLSQDDITLPDANTIWQSDKKTLTPNSPITLSWKSPENILFTININLDDNYLFNINKKVENLSDSTITLASYGRINRFFSQTTPEFFILHEGPIGVFDGILHEVTYKKTRKKPAQTFQTTNKSGWLGISDKYWLNAIIFDNDNNYKARFSYQRKNDHDLYNSDFISDEITIKANQSAQINHKLFSGAKEVSLLDQYSKDYNITLFDRAVDFGWFYFVTKPFYFILQIFNSFLGNFGLAIILMTVLVKLAFFPLANKSYASMSKMKDLHPKVMELKEKYKDDKMGMNQAVMAMYKKEGANPASGCLPILIQLPIFFALYKVLFVTIDMRHAPFYGFVTDLSAKDPTSIFNLFGLLPFSAPTALAIGILPIIMGLTMVIQQKLNPPPTDPTHAKMMKILPYLLIFLFASFPAGLLIYWIWSNILSILQQYVISRHLHKK